MAGLISRQKKFDLRQWSTYFIQVKSTCRCQNRKYL